MSPEYVMGGAFSVKSDTYSFGVLLLEIVSGFTITSPQLVMNFVGLTAYVSMDKCTESEYTRHSNLIISCFYWLRHGLWEDGKATELVHSSVIESCSLDEFLWCIHVGLLCVQDCPNDRPLMASVTFMLENGSALLPAPKQPTYFALQNFEAEESRENSVNTVTITTLEGR